MRRLVQGVLLSFALAACGSAPPPAAPPPPAPAPAAPVAMCAEGTPRQPNDVRERMGALGEDVRRCFLVGGRTDEAVKLTADVVISDDGKVKKARISGAPASKKAAVGCAERTLEGATFSSFCGDDVSLAWTYAIQ